MSKGVVRLVAMCKVGTQYLDDIVYSVKRSLFKTVLSSGYILILLSIEYILASLIEMCQG